MYTIEMIDSFEEFRKIEGVWNEALSRSGREAPFMTHEWFSCWWEAFGAGKKMRVLLVKEKGAVVALAPLMKTRLRVAGLPAAAVTFMHNTIAPRAGVIVLKDDERIMNEMLDFLSSPGQGHHLLMLDSLEKASPANVMLRSAITSRSLPCRQIDDARSPYIPIAGSWDDYLKGRSKSFRYQLNRLERLFAKKGDCEIRTYATAGDAGKAMEELLAVSRKTWKFRAGTAIASRPESTRFFTLLAHKGMAGGWLSIWMLKCGGKPVAFQYVLDDKRKMTGLKMEFDEEYRAMVPGKFLAQRLIQYCFDHRYDEFDMMGRDEGHKMEWSSVCRPHCKYLIFNPTPYGRMLHFLETKAVPRLRGVLAPGATAARG
ncbi:MAG: GNAT family N-acetyltransferase [Endomicrobiales bacterium]